MSAQAAAVAYDVADAMTAPSRQESARRARLKHGIYSKYAVIPGEDIAEYESFREDMLEDLQPEGVAESKLVEHLVQAQWKLQRLWANETGVYLHYDQGVPQGDASLPLRLARCGQLDANDNGELERISRHQQRVFNQFHKALRTLATVRDQRNNGLLGKQHATVSNDEGSREIADRPETPVTVAERPEAGHAAAMGAVLIPSPSAEHANADGGSATSGAEARADEAVTPSSSSETASGESMDCDARPDRFHDRLGEEDGATRVHESIPPQAASAQPSGNSSRPQPFLELPTPPGGWPADPFDRNIAQTLAWKAAQAAKGQAVA